MKKIIGVGFEIPSNEEDIYTSFDSFSSLSDCDIAIFYPAMSKTSYSVDIYNSDYEGERLYNKSSSVNIVKHSLHWRNEIESMLRSGKNVYIILSKKEEYFIYTGTKDISGTGRNQKTTFHVASHNNYSFLLNLFEFQNSSGQVVKSVSSIFNGFYSFFQDYIDYECYIKAHEMPSEIIFQTKSGDKDLGLIHQKEKGYIILLPNIELYGDDFWDDDEYGNEYWTKEATQLGKRFIEHIAKIDKSIRGEVSKTPQPDWVNHNSYQIKVAEVTKKEIEKNNKKIETLKNKNEQLRLKANEQEQLKDLLYETGKALESAVTESLKLLGYNAENYDDGTLELDQVINSPEGYRYIGECEGKDTKDIDITKFRQLQDSMNEDFQREEVDEKAFGLLFGNPQRLIAPSKRILNFTKKCKKGADREKIGLIKTTDLFRIAKYLLENKDEEFKKKCRKDIHKQLGKIVKFPAVPKKK